MLNTLTDEEDARSLGGQAEVNRRHLIKNSNLVGLLKEEIFQMQKALNHAHIRIKELNNELAQYKKNK